MLAANGGTAAGSCRAWCLWILSRPFRLIPEYLGCGHPLAGIPLRVRSSGTCDKNNLAHRLSIEKCTMCSFASMEVVEFDGKIDRVDKKLIYLFGAVTVGQISDKLRFFLIFS